MSLKKANENTLCKIIEAIYDAGKKERQKEKPYKELFKAGSTHTGLLRELEEKMSKHVFDACDIYEERHGITINSDQYHMLLCLPLLAQIAEKDAERNEGRACCVDKAYFMLSEHLKDLGDK